MLLASANYTSLKKMVSRFLEIICFASGTKEQALEACKDCVPDSPTPTLFHHVCEAAESLPSVYSTGDRKRRKTQCSLNLGSCKDNVRGNTALRGMQRGLGDGTLCSCPVFGSTAAAPCSSVLAPGPHMPPSRAAASPTPPTAVATVLGEQHDHWHQCERGTSAERPLPLASCLWLRALLRRGFPDGAT